MGPDDTRCGFYSRGDVLFALVRRAEIVAPELPPSSFEMREKIDRNLLGPV